jgi:hydrogenase/urease accessory protein HupE
VQLGILPRLALLFAFVLAARAHQPGLSTLYLEVTSNQLTAQLFVAWQELNAVVLLDSNADRTLTEAELAAARPRLIGMGESALSLDSDGRLLALKQPVQVSREDETGVRFLMIYELPSTKVLSVTSEIISELQRGHNQVVTVRDAAGKKLGEALLDRERPTVDVPLAALQVEPEPRIASTAYFGLGLEHIVMGWDHLAFLFGLLVIGGTLRDAVKIITSFTLAHSLTLALVTLNVFRVPPEVIEPLIAASIVYVGVENLVRKDFSKRWMLTFAFGLVHGCGFAFMLQELGLGDSVVTPLVWFNLGVEAGQLAIAAVMLPVIWKLKPRFPNRWVPVTSALLILLGNYFLLERLVGE